MADAELSVEPCFSIEIAMSKLNFVMVLLCIFHEHRFDSCTKERRLLREPACRISRQYLRNLLL